MDDIKIKQPKQQRAVEKKEKIVQVAFDLICKKGYANSSTTEIAQKSGVSTGTIYNYFNNKRDIYLEVYAMYYNQIVKPMIEKFQNSKPPFRFKELIENMLTSTAEHHVVSEYVHDEMMRLVNTDEDFAQLHRKLQFKTVDFLATFARNNGYNVVNMHEKFHIFLEISDMYSHELAYHKTEELDYSRIKDTVVSFMLYMMME